MTFALWLWWPWDAFGLRNPRLELLQASAQATSSQKPLHFCFRCQLISLQLSLPALYSNLVITLITEIQFIALNPQPAKGLGTGAAPYYFVTLFSVWSRISGHLLVLPLAITFIKEFGERTVFQKNHKTEQTQHKRLLTSFHQ